MKKWTRMRYLHQAQEQGTDRWTKAKVKVHTQDGQVTQVTGKSLGFSTQPTPAEWAEAEALRQRLIGFNLDPATAERKDLYAAVGAESAAKAKGSKAKGSKAKTTGTPVLTLTKSQFAKMTKAEQQAYLEAQGLFG